MTGIVKALFISPSAAKPMQQVDKANLHKNKGIDGDRYYLKTGNWSTDQYKADYNLSLIETENINDFKSQNVNLPIGDFRRNIITEGINLNDLVNQHFMIGDVLCKGIRLCEPCRYLEEITSLKLVKIMLNKGGLRAQILTNGVIKPGDTIRQLNRVTA